MTFLKLDQKASQDLSEGALDETISYNKPFKLEQVLIVFSENITETITITLDSAGGSDYDTVLDSKDLNSQNNYVFHPDRNFQAGDKIRIQCTNANVTGIAYVTVKASELN